MSATQRRLLAVAIAGVTIVVAHWLDPWAYRTLVAPSVGEKDWGRLLRILGFAPTWLAIAGLFWLESRQSARSTELRATAGAVVVAVIVGGLLSELAKLLIRRERPNLSAGVYQFRSFGLEPFDTSQLGMPSGHAMVAFSGAGALSRRYPRTAPLLLALAAGCGLTRVLAHAHFLSDVVAGAVGGGWLGAAVADRFGRGPGGGAP